MTCNKNNVIITTKQPKTSVEIDGAYVFDLLAHNLSTKSKNPSIARRAFQLQGYSLQEAIKKVKGHAFS